MELQSHDDLGGLVDCVADDVDGMFRDKDNPCILSCSNGKLNTDRISSSTGVHCDVDGLLKVGPENNRPRVGSAPCELDVLCVDVGAEGRGAVGPKEVACLRDCGSGGTGIRGYERCFRGAFSRGASVAEPEAIELALVRRLISD